MIAFSGCGNSSLSEEMYADGFTKITNIDYSPAVIENMRERCCKLSHMDWQVMDITDLQFDNGTFEVVIEKGTLDAMLVSENDPWNISAEGEEMINKILGQVCSFFSKRIRLKTGNYNGSYTRVTCQLLQSLSLYLITCDIVAFIIFILESVLIHTVSILLNKRYAETNLRCKKYVKLCDLISAHLFHRCMYFVWFPKLCQCTTPGGSTSVSTY